MLFGIHDTRLVGKFPAARVQVPGAHLPVVGRGGEEATNSPLASQRVIWYRLPHG